MSANTYALDALTRHQVYLQRYASGEIKKMLPLLESMLADINARILRDDLTVFQAGRLSALQNDVRSMIQAGMNVISGQLSLDLNDLASYEAGFTQRLLDGMITIQTAGVNEAALSGLLSSRPMSLIQGGSRVRLTIDQAIRQFAGTLTNDLNGAIQSGIAQGSTTHQIAQEVTRIVTNRTRAQAEALIRTVANHAATIGRNQLYADNSDILDGEKFTATLDNRTTITCGSNDGKVFPVGQGLFPPLHYNCRSIRIPQVNPAFTIAELTGERPSIGADGAEIVSGQTTYGGWLRRQSSSFQDEVLGADRGRLFRSGGLSIGRFTDNTGVVYDLDDLRRLEPQAFERAGL